MAIWIPTDLDRLEAPDEALREDLSRARALADAAPDATLDRERAWWRFLADGVFELEIGPQDSAGWRCFDGSRRSRGVADGLRTPSVHFDARTG
ncbi:MAG: hypothetical protein H6720_20195 [Sandaracinus sp.]|nr:hypothetical protein [Sandaracinus sp.]